MTPSATPHAHRVLPLAVLLAASVALSACARGDDAAPMPDAASIADADAGAMPPPPAVTDTADAVDAVAADAAMQPAAANDADTGTDADTMADAAAADGRWEYGSKPGEDGDAATAQIAGSTDDGRQVVLAFVDDPTWGGSARVEGLPGPIECPNGCRVGISIDGGAETSVPASRPTAENAPVLSLRKPRDLWRDLAGARELRLSLPDGSVATFQVAGLDGSRLPGLD